MLDERLLGHALGEPASWSAWLAVLRGAFGLPLSEAQAGVFHELAGGRAPPSARPRELWLIAGRRSGKSRMAGALAAYTACLGGQRASRGETGYVLTIAPSVDQAKLVHGYARAFIEESQWC